MNVRHLLAAGVTAAAVATAVVIPPDGAGQGLGVARAGHADGYVPADPLVPDQWYIARTRAFDAWQELPPLAPVRVAVIDSGVDRSHPDLAGRIVAARSFVGGSAKDTRGHGTVVSGIVAAQSDNGIGIAGLAPSAELVVAKVTSPDGTISLAAEAKAIRWAVDRGARVINLSLGGLRDPTNAARDNYSPSEAEAIRYAVRKGVLVVAAVGNGDQSPREPWPYAAFPAALPHVLGVSAVARSGSVPSFSNRDPIYNDLAAPGVAIISTFPRALTAKRPDCEPQGYTPCASDDFVEPLGTSFAAPQVTAVAANLLAVRPDLRAEQLAALLTRTAVDSRRGTGCKQCPGGRDPFTGWGEVDGAAALTALDGPLPPADALEPNDDTGSQAARLALSPTGSEGIRATVDYWDDRNDVYAVELRAGERLFASLGSSGLDASLTLWDPNASTLADASKPLRLRRANGSGRVKRLSWVAARDGWHFLQVAVATKAGPVPYRLSLVRRAA